MSRERIDRLLVARGLADSRARAQALLSAEQVEVGGRLVKKPSELVARDAEIRVLNPPRYVSRGGMKLEGALCDLSLSVAGLVVADIGASTGGFTDCVLSAGACKVYAIDVGHGQLHERLTRDPRVVGREGQNARTLSRDSLPEPVDLVLVDASFIGLGKLLPALVHLLAPDGRILCLVKPQFEVGKAHLSKRGVVRDDGARLLAVEGVVQAAQVLGLELLGQADCRLPGPEGNREIFVLFQRSAARNA